MTTKEKIKEIKKLLDQLETDIVDPVKHARSTGGKTWCGRVTKDLSVSEMWPNTTCIECIKEGLLDGTPAIHMNQDVLKKYKESRK